MALEVPRWWAEIKAIRCSSLSVLWWNFLLKGQEKEWTFHFFWLFGLIPKVSWHEKENKKYPPHRCDQSHCTPAWPKCLRIFVSQQQVLRGSKMAKESGEASTSYIRNFLPNFKAIGIIIWEHEASWAWKVVVNQSLDLLGDPLLEAKRPVWILNWKSGRGRVLERLRPCVSGTMMTHCHGSLSCPEYRSYKIYFVLQAVSLSSKLTKGCMLCSWNGMCSWCCLCGW